MNVETGLGLETASSFPLCMRVKGRCRRAVEQGRKTLRRSWRCSLYDENFYFPKKKAQKGRINNENIK